MNEENIIFIVAHARTYSNIEDAIESVEICRGLTEGKKCLFLIPMHFRQF